jgi:ATP-dependent helicase/nuclease subunit A
VAHGRPLDDHGEPTELRELVELVAVVRASELWARAAAAERSLAEVAFAIPGLARRAETPARSDTPRRSVEPTGRRQLDLFGASADDDPALFGAPARGARADVDSAQPDDVLEGEDGVTVLEGVVDLAFREADGWVIADYKTDVGTDPDFVERSKAYRRQVDLYAEAWSRLTGEPVKERVLFYTAQRRIETW